MSNLANAMIHLRSSYPTLRPAERRVADEILDDPKRAVHLSITELAKRAEVSDSTVVKFCKRLGYKGFQEFKILLAQDVATKPILTDGEIELGNDVKTIKEKIFQASINALQDTARVLDSDALEVAVQAIAKAKEIHFYGLGASGIVAQYAERKFSRIGLRVGAFVDTHMQIARAVHLQPGDVAISLSFSGETKEIVEANRAAKVAGALSIAITSYSRSTLAQEADLLLLISAHENVCRGASLSCHLTQLSTIDTLFTAVALADHSRTAQAIERTKDILSQRH